MSNLDYNGRPKFERPRKLSEESNFISRLKDLKRPISNEREEAITNIFKGLGQTFIKGDKLQQALKNMEPAQFIPIEEGADLVSKAASRLDNEASLRGTIITYSMYTNAIDYCLKQQWNDRIKYTAITSPISLTNTKTESSTTKKDDQLNLIKEFLEQNGIASIIIGMLTLSPFQSIIFSTLEVEEGAKSVQLAQIAPGIALLLELGIKAERIYSMLKSTKISAPLVEQQIAELSTNDSARAAALESVGITKASLSEATAKTDSEVIINYVSEYYQRYGGLVSPDSHLTIDHWIAYSQVARNQQTIRSALDVADTFSTEFMDIRDSASGEFVGAQSTQPNRKPVKMFIQLAGATKALRERSSKLYDDIVDSLQYQLTDKDLCCLVQIFGANYDTDMLKTIAGILRILAVDLSGELIRIDNLLRRFLANAFQSAIFQIVTQLNKFYWKILHKLTKMFTLNIPGAEACGGLLTIGLALLQAVRTIFKELESLIAEISALIGDYGQAKPGGWTVAADRRHLLGIARVLEVIATRLDTAKACERVSTPRAPGAPIDIDSADFDGSAILSIIEKSEPVLALSAKDAQKYFPNRKPRVSETLRFSFGISNEQNPSSATPIEKCSDASYQAKIENLIHVFKEALTNLDE